MLIRIKTWKKVHMIILQDYGESGDKVQDYTTTTKHLVTCTMLVYTTVHPVFWSYTG